MIDAIDASPAGLAALVEQWAREQAKDGKMFRRMQAWGVPGIREDMTVAELLQAFGKHDEAKAAAS
jgi:hypothetical protein